MGPEQEVVWPSHTDVGVKTTITNTVAPGEYTVGRKEEPIMESGETRERD